MPPVLEPEKSKIDGLAFIGLSLSRASTYGHHKSITHQNAFDLNDIIDRDYEFVQSTNDDGWLVGGGEPGPPHSYKLAAKDSAHVEIMRVGTLRPDWGGIGEENLISVLKSGKILIPQIEIVPTEVRANGDMPPELEVRFDMSPSKPNFDNLDAPLPVNWALQFVHNQLFKYFHFPSRFCPGPFHSTIARKVEFRSAMHRLQYFQKCEHAIQKWRKAGPQPLNTAGRDAEGKALENKPEYSSGLWLFTDRQNCTQYFPPNFLPPYDTPEKKKIILGFLSEEWDEKNLSWKRTAPAKRQRISITAEEEDESFLEWVSKGLCVAPDGTDYSVGGDVCANPDMTMPEHRSPLVVGHKHLHDPVTPQTGAHQVVASQT